MLTLAAYRAGPRPAAWQWLWQSRPSAAPRKRSIIASTPIMVCGRPPIPPGTFVAASDAKFAAQGPAGKRPSIRSSVPGNKVGRKYSPGCRQMSRVCFSRPSRGQPETHSPTTEKQRPLQKWRRTPSGCGTIIRRPHFNRSPDLKGDDRSEWVDVFHQVNRSFRGNSPRLAAIIGAAR